jgi:prepilin-type N-terminal cleavage/methylation domain-containing protein
MNSRPTPQALIVRGEALRLEGAREAAARPAPGNACGARAFTILEIMLAIAIFSMVIAAIYSSWSAILRASKVGAAAAEELQRSRIAARTLQDALTCSVMFSGNPLLYSFEAVSGGDFADLSFVARVPPSFPGSGYFGDQVVRRVRFSVEKADNGLNQLLLTQVPLLQTNRDDLRDYSIVLARQVSVFTMEFWDARVNKWTDEWVRTNELPKLVRFALAFTQGASAARQGKDVTTRTVSIASSAVAPEVQTPRGLPGGPGPGRPGAPGTGPGVAPPGGAPGAGPGGGRGARPAPGGGLSQ